MTKEMTIVEQLRDVPRGQQIKRYHGERDVTCMIGELCHRAAADLDALKRSREQERNYADVCYENQQLRAVLDEINMLACYASEENTDAREAALLEIGRLARGERKPKP
jgi:hypothetical protein